MTDLRWKTAAAQGSRQAACPCKKDTEPDQAAQSMDAVWQDPTAYDALEHGPPYMPQQKLASTEDIHAEVGRMVKAFTYSGQKLADHMGGAKLVSLLTAMQGLTSIHQSHHWMTTGPSAYGDHLMFGRLYDDSSALIDGVAERAVGITGNPSLVNAVGLATGSLQAISFFNGGAPSVLDPDQMVQVSLKGELTFLAFVKQVLEAMRTEGSATDGVEDMIQGIASKHEEFVYLLKQRAG